MADQILKLIFSGTSDKDLRKWDAELVAELQNIRTKSLDEDPWKVPYLETVARFFKKLREQKRQLPSWAKPLADGMAAVTAKTIENGGSEFRSESTGDGGVTVLKQIAGDIRGKRAKIMGFGAVSQPLIERMIRDEGVIVEMIAERTGVAYKRGGFTLEDVQQLKLVYNDANGFGALGTDPQYTIPGVENKMGDDFITEEDFFLQPADILVLGAKENQVTRENVHLIDAKIYLELANGAITSGAYDQLLQDPNITVIPDTVGNPGGVTVSYLEWLQNRTNQRWTKEEVKAEMDKKLIKMVKDVNAVRKKYKTDLRTAADILMIQRVLAARNARIAKEQKKSGPKSEVRSAVNADILNPVIWTTRFVAFNFAAPGALLPAGILSWNQFLFPSPSVRKSAALFNAGKPAPSSTEPRTVVLVSSVENPLNFGANEMSALGLAPGSRVVALNRRGRTSALWNDLNRLRFTGVRSERAEIAGELPTRAELQKIFAQTPGTVPVLVLPPGMNSILEDYTGVAEGGFAVSFPRRADAGEAFAYLIGHSVPASLIRDVPSDDLLKISVKPGLSPVWVQNENRFAQWAGRFVQEHAFARSA